MSDFWNNLTRKVNSVSNTAAKKVDELTNIAKLNLNLREKENDLEDCFEKIGSLVYDKVKRSYETDEEVAACIKQADDLHDEIAKIKAELRKAKKTKSCSACGKEVSSDAKFCSACGSHFDETAEEAPAKETEAVAAVEAETKE